MIDRRRIGHALCRSAAVLWASAAVLAHSGPPYPILSDQVVGQYRLSIWTDPDATDDGVAAGQFWVTIDLTDGSALPPETRATVTIRALDRTAPTRSARTTALNNEPSRQFVALLIDHEGPFAVQATISGPRGDAVAEATVDATYDLRPARWLIGLYLMPFLAVGGLWIKLLVRKKG